MENENENAAVAEVAPNTSEDTVTVSASATSDDESGSTTETAAEKKAAFLKIQYNHEDMDIDEEKARELAQKGLAYDSLKSKYEDHKGLKFLESYASKLGITVDDLVDNMKKQEEDQELRSFQEANGITDMETARKLFEKEQVANKFLEQEKAKQAQADEEKKHQKEYEELCDFSMKAFGKEFKVEDLPKEVVELAQKDNTSLASAWAKQILIAKKNEEEIAKLNNQNSGTSLGSIKNTDAKDETEITEADLENMSPSEMARNLPKVMRLFNKK